MPTPATEHTWDLQPVLDLLKGEVDPVKGECLEQLRESTTHVENTYYAGQFVRIVEEISADPKEIEGTRTKRSNTLGDFSRLWAQLGVQPDLPPPPVIPVEPIVEEQPSSADEALSSSPTDNPEENRNAPTHIDNVPPLTSGNATDVGQEGDDEFAGMTKGQKKKARKAAKRAAEEQRLQAQLSAKAEEAREKEVEKEESHRMRLEQFKLRQRMEKEEQAEALQGAATNMRALDLAPRQIVARKRSKPKDKLPRVGSAPQEPHKHTPDMMGTPVQARADVHPLPPRPALVPEWPPNFLESQEIVPQIMAMSSQSMANLPHTASAMHSAHPFNSSTPGQQQPISSPFMFSAGLDTLPSIPVAMAAPVAQPNLSANPHPQLVPRTVQPVTPKNITPGSISTPANQSYFPMYVDPRLAPQVVQPFASQFPSSGAMMNPTYSAYHPTPTPVQLIPRTVQPVAPRTPVPAPKSGLTIRPAIDRHFLQLQQLLFLFPEDQKWLVAPMQLLNNKLSPEAGVHIFVDASNILIGFRDKLKNARTQMFDLSFDSLALLLERRRPVARRVLAGSSRNGSLPSYVNAFITKAEEVGYENNVYEQVYKEKELTERQRFFKDVDRIGYKAAVALRSGGESSDSETGAAAVTPAAPSPMKWVEQGVDENLHLKMCQSILDADVPATMVLATGDGAAAEYSDGFLAHVERALKRGWTVELVSWKQQINGGYTKKKWQAKWGAKFKVILLDDFVESLVET